MASGKTHDWVTLAVLPPVLIVCRVLLHWNWPDCLLITAGTWLGGMLLSPDLDTRSRPFYRWGLLRFIWWPYQWAIRHRSSASHGVLFAPWFRLLYLTASLVLLYVGIIWAWGQLSGMHSNMQLARSTAGGFLSRHIHDILVFGAGIWLGSLLHTLLDALSSASPFRRRRR